jgi:hypothetical protein
VPLPSGGAEARMARVDRLSMRVKE